MHENFNNCLAAVFGSASAVGGAVMAAGIWAIWKARNQACWELKVVRPEVAADWAREVCVARTSRDVHGGTMVTSEGSGLQQLNRPDLLRYFVDAAMFEQDGSTSVAEALLDGAGTFIGGFNKLVTCPFVPSFILVVSKWLPLCSLLIRIFQLEGGIGVTNTKGKRRNFMSNDRH
ncbi:unnamed protein product [Cuscuta campestris]|uniref:Uncharacterized protein n=1 Tax=Cuscuta campestris TaxID=132261 RepID=A0A484MKQ1_9ASTE|nr:unnamed protein product [Cuscuta campestris]